eukprot:11175509-Lingulodinium_polyedra.AAC.1
MVKRAAEGAVVKALRATRFLDWVPGKQSLQPFSQRSGQRGGQPPHTASLLPGQKEMRAWWPRRARQG